MENVQKASSKSLFDQIKNDLRKIYGSEEAAALAFALLKKHFGLEKTDILALKEITIFDESLEALSRATRRLKNQEPLQYVTGEAPFYGRWFEVSSAVLIPRPETEELVDRIVKTYRSSQNLRIIDIGTGSGCIAVSLAAELKNAEVWAADVDAGCLETARRNAAMYHTAVYFLQTDVLDAGQDAKLPVQAFDLIVSNPPYIPASERTTMARHVVDHEPHKALFVPDTDPLIFYKALLRIADRCLKPNGAVYAEIHEKFKKEILELFSGANRFEEVSVRKDIHEKPRMLSARGRKN